MYYPQKIKINNGCFINILINGNIDSTSLKTAFLESSIYFSVPARPRTAMSV